VSRPASRPAPPRSAATAVERPRRTSAGEVSRRRRAPADLAERNPGRALRRITLHGHRVAYRAAGERGPVIVLVHGITSNSATWEAVMALLSAEHQVVAPDLFGHGQSAKPRGDYSLGAYASGVRDLLVALGHERATVVGHSLGGGVAMQMSYQYPDLAERLVLVGSGGLGREVNVLLRAASLPGAELVLPLLTKPGLLDAGLALGRLLGRLGLNVNTDVREVAQGHATLADAEARQAFLSTLRAIVDVTGQRVDARDRLYLASALPTLIIWGRRDPIIPVAHGREAHQLIPGSRFEVFEDAGHYPHVEEPHRFAALLGDFISGTEAADVDIGDWQQLLRSGEPLPAPAGRRGATSTGAS
jgi:pimeloyl-ACP methyl ester carboxylesterase